MPVMASARLASCNYNSVECFSWWLSWQLLLPGHQSKSLAVYNPRPMYDIYVNHRNDLLVVPRGNSIPSDLTGKWRKKKPAVRLVSEKIRQDVKRHGYYCRSLVGRGSKGEAR